eukprot:g853.t1
MPQPSVSRMATIDDVNRVEIAKFILGSGGENSVVDGEWVVTPAMVEMMTMEVDQLTVNPMHKKAKSTVIESGIEIINPAGVNSHEDVQEEKERGEKKVGKSWEEKRKLLAKTKFVDKSRRETLMRGVLPTLRQLDRHIPKLKALKEQNVKRRNSSLTSSASRLDSNNITNRQLRAQSIS